jgi:2-octaprenyl-6-methoxyphenol hydroxylase
MDMEREQIDILVAGGGVAGLSAAAGFAAAGFTVVCVDPAPPVTDGDAAGSDLRSTAFLMPSVAFFRRTGLWERLSPHAAELRIMRLADAGGPTGALREIADFAATELGAPSFGYNLPNWLLRREMVAHLDALPAARLLAPARVERLTPRSAGAVVRLSPRRTLEARLVVAADGRDSFVREAVGIPARRWGYGQKANVFTVTHELPHDGISTEIHRTGGPFTLVPLPDRDKQHHSAVVWMEAGPRATALNAMPAADFDAELNARACGVLGTLRLASSRRLWPIVSQVADRLDGPRTALVAEAAHVVPPIGAQGLNMSLRDIAALIDLCVDARDAGRDFGAPEVLARYHRVRHGDILMRVAGIDVLNRAAMAEAPSVRDLRRTGLRLLHRLGPLRRSAMTLGLGASTAGDR